MKLFTTLAALMFGISSYAQSNLDSGLVAAYPFSGNANDISGHNLNGTVTGAQLTIDRYGKANSAYLFDGTSNVIQVNNMDTYLSKDEVSVSVWARPDLLKEQVVFMLSPDDPGNRMLGAINFDQSTPYVIWDFGDIYNHGRLSIGQYDQGAWEHYVFWSSKSKNITKIYRNGHVLAAANNSSGLTTLTNKAFLIGGGIDYNNTHFYFQGAIDDIRIYNRTLSDSEVSVLYHNTITTGITGIQNNDKGIQIYPNPAANGIFNLRLANAAAIREMSVYDFTGRRVYKNQCFTNSIDLTGQAKGLYLLKITGNNDQIDTYKLILE